MTNFEFSNHAKYMLARRDIPEEWVWRVINNPDEKGRGNDGNMHYTKSIREKENRVLHLVVNTDVQPSRIVTLFFDRRLRKKK